MFVTEYVRYRRVKPPAGGRRPIAMRRTVVLGATGFVGQQAITYLANQPTKLRWAIAGRSEAKLLASR